MGIFNPVVTSLFSPISMILMLGGSIMGIIFGALPGLSGTIGVTLLLPLTFGMSPNLAIALLISVWVGGVSGGFISATLLGIPGTASSVATCFDAFPLSKQGKTTKALGVGILASFIGTFLSAIIAMVLSPFIAKLAIKLGPWEIFSLCFSAITLIVSMSKGNIFKGLASASIGLVFSSVGFAPVDAYNRFSFGNIYLSGGLNGVALMLGLFTVYLIAMDYSKRSNDYVVEDPKDKIHGFGVTFKEIKNNIWNMIRSFAIGLWIGFLPGMGAGLSNLLAYSQAKNSSKYPEKFGKGCIDGVFASETSNNAAVGGAMIPMTSLGIPGDATTAVLLGGLILHGLQPGPLLFNNNPVFVYVMYGATIIAAIMVLLLQFFGMRLLPKILKIPYHYLYPTILILCFIGAFSETNTLFNTGLMLFFGFFSILMGWIGLPSTPFLMAFILGPMLEVNLRRGISYSTTGLADFITRPVSALFLLVGIGSIILPPLRRIFKRI